MYFQIEKNGWRIVASGTTEVYIHHHAAPAPCPWEDRRVVGRFKYARPGASAKSFAKFLTANFTPAEFFALVDAGMSPLSILETKGYVSPNERAARRYHAQLAAVAATRMGA